MNLQSIAKLLNIAPNSKYGPGKAAGYDFNSLLRNVGVHVRYEELDYKFETVGAYGISWSISTGRISGQVEFAIKRLSPYKALDLVVEVVENCETIANVPAFLNKKFAC